MYINNLPDNLLIEILQRLPSHYVFRCKSVCKDWHSLISDPCFIRSFISHHQGLNHSPPFTLVHQFSYWHHNVTETASRKIHAVSENHILQHRDFHLDFLPCYEQRDPWPIRIVASQEDLIVCYDNKSYSSQESAYYICNLLTKQWQAIPTITGRIVEDDTAIGLITYGNDPSIANYKLVKILKLGLRSSRADNQLKAEIFSSETGEWSETYFSCPQGIRRFWQFRTSSVTAYNTLHWMIKANYGETIIAFDPFSDTKGQCRLVDLPQELKFEMAHCCLGNCKGKLRVSTLKGVHPNRMLSVWELQDYDKGKWCLDYRICLKDMVFISDGQFDALEFSTNLVLCFHPDDSDIVYLRHHNHIMKCNMRKRTLEVVSELLDDWTFSIHTHTVFPLLHPSWPSAVGSQSI